MAPELAATASLNRAAQLEMYRRATKTLPGGTDSSFRAWGEDTIYVDRGKGARVWDIDGNEFIDLLPEPDSREPWFVCEAHAQGDIVDRVVSIFADSFHAALEARAQGSGA
jgi:hypothetical protein